MFPETISSGHKDLLEIISKQKNFKEKFYLAGGPALALQIGHRKRFDLDFFTTKDFNVNDIAAFVSKELKGKIILTGENTIYAETFNIKVSFISFKYKILKNL